MTTQEQIIEEVVNGISIYLHHQKSTKSKCDRGTSPLFTKGGTTQEAQMQKHYRIFNGCTATRPGVNSAGKQHASLDCHWIVYISRSIIVLSSRTLTTCVVCLGNSTQNDPRSAIDSS